MALVSCVESSLRTRPWSGQAAISSTPSSSLPVTQGRRSKVQREQAEVEPSLRFLLCTSPAKGAGSIITVNLSAKPITIQYYER